MHLARDLKPVQPPAHIWPAIQRRLNLTTRQTALRRIRSFALAASVVLVVGVAALLYWRSVPVIRATTVATISAKSGEHLWELEVFGNADRLVARAAKLPARPAAARLRTLGAAEGRSSRVSGRPARRRRMEPRFDRGAEASAGALESSGCQHRTSRRLSHRSADRHDPLRCAAAHTFLKLPGACSPRGPQGTTASPIFGARWCIQWGVSNVCLKPSDTSLDRSTH